MICRISYAIDHLNVEHTPTGTNRYKHVQMFDNRTPKSILVYNFKTHLELPIPLQRVGCQQYSAYEIVDFLTKSVCFENALRIR